MCNLLSQRAHPLCPDIIKHACFVYIIYSIMLHKHTVLTILLIWYGGMVWYGNTLFNDAGPDSNLLVSTGGVKTLTIYKKEKKEEIFTCEYFWCDHNYHLAIISSNNILKLVDRFGYLCVKREAIPQFSPTIIETLFEELSIWFRKG